MPGLQIVDATGDHVRALLKAPLRQADVDEWVLMSGGRTMPDLLETLAGRVEAEGGVRAALLPDGSTLALWGVDAMAPGVGAAWLIASKAAEVHGRWLHREWPKEMGRMHKSFPLLTATSYGYNTLHHHWLDVVGFEPVAFGIAPSGFHFVAFERRNRGEEACVAH